MEKTPEKVIEVINIKKVYRMGHEKICAVDGVSFEINKGEFCCLLGTSGSGKSTLLNLMAGIEKTTSGDILIKGKNIRKMSENGLARFRQKYLGFVFQSYNLMNSMNALENVEFPLVFKRVRPKKRKKLAKEMLVQVGLGKRLNHKPKEMSGGQQQRVGIARAFVSKPEIIFADEPTGNLDTRTAMEVMHLMQSLAKANNETIVMVTHDPRLAEYADKIIHILDGKIQNIEIREKKEVVLEEEAKREEKKDERIEEKISEKKSDIIENQENGKEEKSDRMENQKNRKEEKPDRMENQKNRKEEKPDRMENQKNRKEEKSDRMENQENRKEEKSDGTENQKNRKGEQSEAIKKDDNVEKN